MLRMPALLRPIKRLARAAPPESHQTARSGAEEETKTE